MTIRFISNAVALCMLCVAAARPGRAADGAADLRAVVDAAIQPVMSAYAVPGVAVAVTVNGQSHFFNYGVASREAGTPVTEQTVFEMGSVSKTFTATLAGMALETGKLSLSDHPSKYQPALKGSALDRATLLNLATYTAGGLPLQVPDAIVNRQQMISYLKKWKPDARPGTTRRYSNISIGLFGLLAATSMQSDFATISEGTLFPQLGLQHTYIHVPDSAQTNYAWGYNGANQPVRVNPGVFDEEAYGVKSTATDMLRFVEVNIAPSTLAGPIRAAVEGTHIGYFTVGPLQQGLGWEQYPFPVSRERLLAGNAPSMLFDANRAVAHRMPRIPATATVYNKTGSTGGFGSYVLFVPEKEIGLVILANKNFPIPARVTAAYEILEQLVQMSKS
ncbi:MAG: beta-lactamase [Pseudomonadota bacterium]|nr:beta-lactamase [Pseudomonadota bacterium]